MGTRSAAPQALGYYHQITYALYTILESDVDTRHIIRIEGLGDIASLSKNNLAELLELKHHSSSPGSISDRSDALWRTIRIWSRHLKEKQIKLPGVKLKLITTAKASQGSIAAMLRPKVYPHGTDRDPVHACQKLRNIASEPSKSLKQFTDVFNELSANEQQALVDAIEIFDCAPTITEIDTKIKTHFQTTVPPEHAEEFSHLVVGWWSQSIVIPHLKDGKPKTIDANGVKLRIIEMSRGYRANSLPAYSRDKRFEDLPGQPDPESDKRIFVRQLRRIEIHPHRIKRAILDHYKAYTDRNRWIEEQVYWEDKLYSYDDRLVDEWEERYYRNNDRFKRRKGCYIEEANEQDCVDFGGKLYDEISQLSIPINEQTNYEYITRGSYHELADKLRVKWHPKFGEKS
jgi:hypothetical protein